jgi:hypothetical protein
MDHFTERDRQETSDTLLAALPGYQRYLLIGISGDNDIPHVALSG